MDLVWGAIKQGGIGVGVGGLMFFRPDPLDAFLYLLIGCLGMIFVPVSLEIGAWGADRIRRRRN